VPLSTHYKYVKDDGTWTTAFDFDTPQVAWDVPDVVGVKAVKLVGFGLVISPNDPQPAVYAPATAADPIWPSAGKLATDVPDVPGTFTALFVVPATTDNNNFARGEITKTITIVPPTKTSLAEFKAWLTDRSPTEAGFYDKIRLGSAVDELGGHADNELSFGYQLSHPFVNNQKSLWLDFSASTFNKVDAEAFKLCSNLVRIDLPDTVAEIETLAFDGTSLKTIKLPDHVGLKIGSYAFNPCPNLTSVEFVTADVDFTGSEHPFVGNLKELYLSRTGDARIGVYTFDGTNWQPPQ